MGQEQNELGTQLMFRAHFYLPGGINESENHFQPTPGALWTNSKGAGSKFVDKNAGDNAVKHAKQYGQRSKEKNGDPLLHQEKTDKVCNGKHQTVGAAFHFGSRVVGLEQIVDCQIVNREKHTHAENGNQKYDIVERIIRSSRKIQ